jgi:hypothetical protein
MTQKNLLSQLAQLCLSGADAGQEFAQSVLWLRPRLHTLYCALSRGGYGSDRFIRGSQLSVRNGVADSMGQRNTF